MFEKMMKLFEAQKRHVRRSLKKRMYSEHLPNHPLHDDLYLVSYPKSGVTWLMHMMANVNLRMSGINGQRATFFNVENLIPDVNTTQFIKEQILPFPGCRVLKSHAPYNAFYNRIIYLVRDPRDVMVSYYHFAKKLNTFQGTMAQFIRSREFGIETWNRHIEGWFTETNPSQYINFIKYEDLKSDSKRVLVHIYNLLGCTVPDETFNFAVQNSSFDNMKKEEKEYSRLNLTQNPEFSFVRKGVAGGFKEELTDQDIHFINASAHKWMNIFGYQ